MTVETSSIVVSAPGQQASGKRLFEFSRLIRATGYVAVVLALSVAAVTFFVLMGLTPIVPAPNVVLMAMVVNGTLVAFLIFVVGWEVSSLFLARRRGRAAARLHIRIVAFFSLVAAAPAILVAVVASITLDRGLDNWFSTRTRAIVDTSQSIAQAYADQQTQSLHTDVLEIKTELERAHSLLLDSPDRFQAFLNSLATNHPGTGIFLISDTGSVIARAGSASERDYPPPPPSGIKQAKASPGEPVLISPGPTNIMGSIVLLDGYEDVYLYIGRPLDPKIIRYLAMTADNVSEYHSLEAMRLGVQLAFGILYLGISMVVLLSAIWLGISFANGLVAPIRRLIDAAKQVSQGNLGVAVPVSGSQGDLGQLGSTFNTMTSQLRSQREELLSASDQIDTRRRFTEAVLSGVTAGVAGIDPNGRVTIVNRSALRFLGVEEDKAVGQLAVDLLPQLGPVLVAAFTSERTEQRDQITVMRGGRERTLAVRVTSEGAAPQAQGYVITLDDITDLVSAQRNSAWADVARRIAHEIKNPLTPIQLSAERLRRRFGQGIQEGREVFDQCIDTIVRQVGDIGRMVDEFSSFARMPKPTFEPKNLSESIREAVFLLEVAHPDIAFKLDLPERPLLGRFDSRLMAQALTNIVKNATEAIGAVPTEMRGKGEIRVVARADRDNIVVDVIDNGIGLPTENRRRLLEPYMTTREKGTGLGLAIVTKIIEDHGGSVDLLDAPSVATGGHGAMVRITLPRLAETADSNAGPVEPAPAN